MLGKWIAKLTGSQKGKKPRKDNPSAAKKKKVARPKGKPKKQPPPSSGPEKEIGRVVAFFRVPVVVVVRLTRGGLKLSDRIWIKGNTTDLKQVVASMQINHQPIREARKGQEVGVKVSSRARRGDRVHLIAATS